MRRKIFSIIARLRSPGNSVQSAGILFVFGTICCLAKHKRLPRLLRRLFAPKKAERVGRMAVIHKMPTSALPSGSDAALLLHLISI